MKNGNGIHKKSYTIMIADDDQAILDATSMILEDEGYSVQTTTDGHSIKKMQKSLPDLLLLDIWMSGVDGREICKYLKADNKTMHVPVIMVSANRDTEKIAKEAGAEDFLAKPFDIDDLLQKVEKYLKN